ncbi:hypothetical protein V2K57_13305 [Pseudomonas alliivorans]|nr:hypothetical protein [Pseudomonas alliivorans]MEE4701810.1 hypothetical protein [Pseudomonas alliivorans]MEE4737346.1 hypothetical protein [Pseudomonas alliivorans]
MSIPPTVYIAFRVITAALFTGFFSIMNMVSAKENNVSKFRLAWIDGMRNEIAEYTAAAQEISKAQKPEKFKKQKFHTDAEKHEFEIEFFNFSNKPEMSMLRLLRISQNSVEIESRAY